METSTLTPCLAYVTWTINGVLYSHPARGHSKPHAMWLANQWAAANLSTSIPHTVRYIGTLD